MKKYSILATAMLTMFSLSLYGVAEDPVAEDVVKEAAPAKAVTEKAAPAKAVTEEAAPAKAVTQEPAAVKELTDQQILAAADSARGDADGVTWNLEADAPEGKDTLSVQARGTDFLAEYTAPSNLKGEKLLMNALNMWYMKPGTAKAVPISPKQRMLGAASYGDIASTGWSINYTAKKDKDDGACLVYNLTAKTIKPTYDKIKLWVDKKDNVAVKAEYQATSGKAVKSATFEYGNKAGDRKFISKMVITAGSDKATLTYSNITLKKLAASIFSPTAL